ncbi:MAG: folate-binding protein [Oxalobacter sp.]|nr:MAG: folate-binding protein [Oxalobacter sp.]
MTATQHYSDFKTTTFVDLPALKKGFVTPLSSFGMMAFSGTDALSFLHRQLTNDLEHLSVNAARLAGYCTPQGRLLATFLIWKSADHILLQLPQDILPGLQKRLKMYVLRDKVNIAEASELAQLGFGGQAAPEALTPWFTDLPSQAYAKVDNEHGSIIRVSDAFGAPRYLWIMPTEKLATIWPALNPKLTAFSDNTWKLAEIDAGIPHITTGTQEKFVAQMVNFELIGGVSFKKGCYPGQEIVARMQHRGKTPRRMLAARIPFAGDVAAGTEVFANDDPNQACGMIVNAEQIETDRIACLVSLRYPMPEGITVHLGSATGAALQFTPLPYPLEDNALS